MRKIILITLTICIFKCSWCQSNSTYTPVDIATGINTTSEYLLNEENEKRKDEIFKNFTLPREYKIPKFENGEKLHFEDNLPSKEDKLSEPSIPTFIEPTSIQSSYPSVPHVNNNDLSQGVGQSVIIPYNKSMDKFINGVYGYDPNLSLQGNEEYYKRNGYTISYNVKDSTIYSIIGCTVILLFSGVIFISNKKKNDRKYKTQY